MTLLRSQVSFAGQVPQALRELIRVHVTGPAVELAEIDGDTRISEDLDYADAIHLADGILRRLGVAIPAPRIPGVSVGELAALIERDRP